MDKNAIINEFELYTEKNGRSEEVINQFIRLKLEQGADRKQTVLVIKEYARKTGDELFVSETELLLTNKSNHASGCHRVMLQKKNVKPKIIKMDKRYIIGKFGSRGNRDDLLDLINERYAKNPFNKTDEYECNIYFWKSSPESKRPNYNSFFGYESDGAFKGKLFSTFEIPACEWVIFEVNPAQWWKYGDKDVEGWVANNDTYRWLTYKDAVFQFEYYREKFDANKPDSLMEVWYPLEKR